jgi:hypothetical protein
MSGSSVSISFLVSSNENKSVSFLVDEITFDEGMSVERFLVKEEPTRPFAPRISIFII